MKSDKSVRKQSLRERYRKLSSAQKRGVYLVLAVVLLLVVIAAGRVYTVENLRQDQDAARVAADDSLFKEAENLYQDGRHKQAAETFIKYADSATGHQRLHGLLRAAQAFARAEDFPRALTVYELLIDEYKDDISALQVATAMGEAANVAEQSNDLQLAQQYNQRQIEHLQGILEGEAASEREDVDRLLEIAEEYKAHLDSLVRFRESEEARAEAEAAVEEARSGVEDEVERQRPQ